MDNAVLLFNFCSTNRERTLLWDPPCSTNTEIIANWSDSWKRGYICVSDWWCEFPWLVGNRSRVIPERVSVLLVFCTFFGCFPHYLCFSPRTYLLVSSLFNFCDEMRSSSVPVIFSEPDGKILGRKGEKNSRYDFWEVLKAFLPFKELQLPIFVDCNTFWNTNPLKNVALSTYYLLCNWWELQNLSTTENQTYQSCSLASFDGNNNTPWGV